MVGFLSICLEDNGIMQKTKNALNEDSNKTDRKVWPFLRHQKSADKRNRSRLSVDNQRSRPRGARPFLSNEDFHTHLETVSSDDPNSFHRSIGPVLGLAQLFGILPVGGVCSSSPSDLTFKLFTFRVFYAIFVAAMILVMTVLSMIYMIKTLHTGTFKTKGDIGAATAGVAFYGNSLVSMILFFWLSPRWVTLQNSWRAMELFIDSNKSERPRLSWKFIVISSVVLLLALIEHILSIINNTMNFEWGTANSTFSNFLHVYCSTSHSFILDILEYNFSLGIFIFIVSKIATFTWNFTDLFIMLVATGLAERYKTLNKKIIASTSKRGNAIEWCEYRGDYAALSSMVKWVDSTISPLILLSFANNLYFICLQLFNGLSPADSSALSAVYFFGSFAFLIGRTAAVTLLTARINDHCKMALPAIYNCSPYSYNIEVAGAIVTYEVVLLQFAINK